MNEDWTTHLMTEYSADLLKYLRYHTHTPEDAEDILQEVFLSCHKHAAEFDPEKCNEQAWLYIIAKRKLVSYYRAKKDQVSLDAMEPDLTPGPDDMAKAVNVMSCRQALAQVLSKLDERSREVIILRFLKGYSPEETAKRLGISAGNVRIIQSRTLAKMNKMLEAAGFSAEDVFS